MGITKKTILGIVWGKDRPFVDYRVYFFAGIGPLQVGVVLVFVFFQNETYTFFSHDDVLEHFKSQLT